MKGFEAWVAGPWSTLALTWGALAVGTVLGWGLGRRPRGVSRRERLALADAAADRAARQFRRYRDGIWPVPEVHHERRTSTEAFLSPPLTHSGPPEIAHEHPGLIDWSRMPAYVAGSDAWSEHVDQAVDLANGDPITTGEIRAITEDMDAFMAGLLGEHPVPYPDGE